MAKVGASLLVPRRVCLWWFIVVGRSGGGGHRRRRRRTRRHALLKVEFSLAHHYADAFVFIHRGTISQGEVALVVQCSPAMDGVQ